MNHVGRLLRGLFALSALTLSACVAAEDTGSSESAITVCGSTTIKGIDVYHGDNGGVTIDWNAVKGDGMSFAFAKATESTNFTDPMFKTNWAGMKSAGLVRGAYHFFHADVDPTLQANYFIAAVGTLSPGDLVALDLETTNNQTQATITANAVTFLQAVKKAMGVNPILYASPAFLSSFASFSSYPLWVANYGVSCPDVPSAWTTYTFWQSSGTGGISALTGAVDLDSFNGTLTQLQNLGGTPPPPPDAGTTPEAGPDVNADASDSGGSVGSEPDLDAGADVPKTSEPSGSTWKGSSGGCNVGPTGLGECAGFEPLVAWLGLVVLRRRRPLKD